jgi:hypothetical protein
LLLVAKVHDVRPRRQPGGQRRHDHATGRWRHRGLARASALAAGARAGSCKVVLESMRCSVAVRRRLAAVMAALC